MIVGRKFGLIGAAGYIAPRHLKAMRETHSELLVAFDTFDSVGIIDSFYPKAEFFTQAEFFEEYLHKLSDTGNGLDYISICSPNYFHRSHIDMVLRNGSDALCEKPLVLNSQDIDYLRELEYKTNRRVWTILQLRTHPVLLKLKEKIDNSVSIDDYKVDLTYITSRGAWYLRSWKGNIQKSGGLASNIGIHFFDLLTWLFGKIEFLEVHQNTDIVCSGYLKLERAKVTWFLSIDERYIPQEVAKLGKKTYRSIQIEGEEVEFSEGFTDLHTEVYRRTLNGEGFGLDDTEQAIQISSIIRKNGVSIINKGKKHRFLL